MKRNILLLTLTFFLSLPLFAQKNNLVVFSESGEKFVLILNGLRQNQEPATNVKVVDLDQPGYVLKVIFDDKTIPDVDKRFAFVNPGTEVVIAVRMKKGVRKLAYISEAPIKNNESTSDQKLVVYNATPAADTTIVTTTTTTTTTNNNVVVEDRTNTNTTGNPNTTTANPTGISINVDENGMNVKTTGVDINVDGMNVNTNVNTNTTTNTVNSTTSNNSNQVSSDNSARYIANGTMCASPSMTQEQFIKLKYAIDERTLVTKMKVAQEGIQKNCMSSNQVADIVKLFKYASDELEIAKFSYRYTYDTKNYDVVVNALKYEYNKPKLLDLIGSPESTVNTNTNTTDSNNKTTTTTTTVVEKKVTATPVASTSTSSGCAVAMSDADFKTAKASISSKSFEDSRLTVSKQIMKSKCLSTAQVKEIMDLFSFEATKLEFAKAAYDYTTDRDNYYLLNDAFSFESSIDDLNAYIESKK